MKATRVLAAQHQAIEALFDEIGHAGGRDARARLAARIAEELIAHMAAEEGVFYPQARRALRDDADAHAAAHRFDGHVTLRVQLGRVLAAGVDEPAFEAHLDTLRTLFERHAREEERTLFPAVERALGDGELELLGAEVLASRPPVWIVTTDRHARERKGALLRLGSRVSLPLPPARG
jgi:iron-sulfur cluster repair protein YtfE (RIC family)